MDLLWIFHLDVWRENGLHCVVREHIIIWRWCTDKTYLSQVHWHVREKSMTTFSLSKCFAGQVSRLPWELMKDCLVVDVLSVSHTIIQYTSTKTHYKMMHRRLVQLWEHHPYPQKVKIHAKEVLLASSPPSADILCKLHAHTQARVCTCEWAYAFVSINIFTHSHVNRCTYRHPPHVWTCKWVTTHTWVLIDSALRSESLCGIYTTTAHYIMCNTILTSKRSWKDLPFMYDRVL